MTSDVVFFSFTSCRNKACRVPAVADLSYLDIGRVPLAVPPRAADAGKGSFRMVKLVLIGVEEKCGERLLQTNRRWRLEDAPSWLCPTAAEKLFYFKVLEGETDYSEHPHECGVRRGVESSVVVRRGAVVVPRFVAFGVERSSLGIQSADWLEEREKKREVSLNNVGI